MPSSARGGADQAAYEVHAGAEASGTGSEAPDERFNRERPTQTVAQVIRIRRQMQRERKELLADLRPPAGSSDRPWTWTASESNLPTPHSTLVHLPDSVAAGSQEARERGEKQNQVAGRHTRRPEPGATTQSVLAKVNRAHKGLVRKEVWRQKFDFLYKQVAEEMKEEKHNQSYSSSAVTAGAADSKQGLASSALGNTNSLPGRDRLNSSVSCLDHPPLAGSSRVSSRPSSASHGRASTDVGMATRSRSGSTIAVCQRAVTAPAGLRVRSQDRSPRAEMVQSASQLVFAGSGGLKRLGVSKNQTPTASVANDSFLSCSSMPAADHTATMVTRPLPSSSIRGGWCKTGKGRSNSTCHHSRRRQPGGTRGRCGQRAHGDLCSEALPRLLSGSSSLPVLAAERHARELCGIRDEYYGGDELFMHEDILHCTNPDLFPLRPSEGKAFPLRRLVAYNGWRSREGED